MAQKYVNSIMAKRSFILLAFFALFSLLLASRIFKMQVFEYDKYQQEVIDQITVENSVRAERGIIYDRNMNVIAANQTTWRVFISPADIQSAEYLSAVERAVCSLRYTDEFAAATLSGTQNELIANGLSSILGVDREVILEKTAKRVVLLLESLMWDSTILSPYSLAASKLPMEAISVLPDSATCFEATAVLIASTVFKLCFLINSLH